MYEWSYERKRGLHKHGNTRGVIVSVHAESAQREPQVSAVAAESNWF